MFLINTNDDGKPFVWGRVKATPRGYYFLPWTTSHGPSRKPRKTAADSIPKWARPGYLVKRKHPDEAAILVKAYRKGEIWADDAAAAGEIEIVR